MSCKQRIRAAISGILFPLLLLLTSLPAHAAKVTSNGFSYFVDRIPAWVVQPARETGTPSSPARADKPFEVLLLDMQTNLLEAKEQSFHRFRAVAWERTALEGLSAVNIDFNPSYQTLTLHEVTVIRAGKREDRLKKSRISLAQRESRLEQSVYDEMVTAIIAVEDVRVGDVLEYSYTLVGSNPVYGGKFFSYFPLSGDVDLARLHIRLSFPTERDLQWKVHRSDLAPVASQQGKTRVLQVNAENLRGIKDETNVPRWFKVYPWLQVTEYRSWAEVEEWANSFYAIPRDLGPGLEQIVEKIRAEAATPEQRAAGALAFVQDEVRYYSIAVGQSTHRPHTPAQTFSQRFGDCKDKSIMLAAMLGRLGVEARPALVSLKYLRGIAEWLPSPLAFDHLIVRANIDGRDTWMDATATYQGRGLRQLPVEKFGRALVVGSRAGALTEVIAPALPAVDIDTIETYAVKSLGEPVELTAVTRFFGEQAEFLRRVRASSNQEIGDLAKSLLVSYQRVYPSIEAAAAPEIKDDRESNVLVITERYRIPDQFSYERGAMRTMLVAVTSLGPLRAPQDTVRTLPFELRHPVRQRQRIELQWPYPLSLRDAAPVAMRTPQFEFSVRNETRGNRLVIDWDYRSLAEQIAPADFPTYRENLRKARENTYYTVAVPVVSNDLILPQVQREWRKLGVAGDGDGTDYQRHLRRISVNFVIADEVLGSKRLTGNALAYALRDRANAASSLGRRVEALADVDRAIALKPNDADLHSLRGEILSYSGRAEESIVDFDRAIALDPNHAGLTRSRGAQLYLLGRYEAAKSDLTKAVDTASRDDLPYSLFWLYYNSMRMREDGKALLRQHRERVTPGQWPAPAISYFLGESSDEDLLKAARAEKSGERTNLCEAYFFIAQRALIEGNFAKAREWFEKTAASGIVMYVEPGYAKQELARLNRP